MCARFWPEIGNRATHVLFAVGGGVNERTRTPTPLKNRRHRPFTYTTLISTGCRRYAAADMLNGPIKYL